MGDFIGNAWYYCCGWLIVGAIAGGIARQIMGSRNRPLLTDIILGVAGAFVGGIVVGWLGFDDSLNIGFGIGSIITSLIGAIILIAVGRVLFRTR